MYNQAKKIIVENRDFFDALVNALIAKKMVTYKDIRAIRKRINKAA